MKARWISLVALGLGSVVLAADWPQYRGPNRDSRVTEFTPPASWPKELKQKWKVAVGDGVASPVLAGGKVYAFYREGNEEVLRCLDAATGNELWKDSYPAAAITGSAGGYKGPRSSPAVADGKVVTFGVWGVVSCLDANSGKVLWREDTKAWPQFNTSSSPAVLDGTVVVHVGGVTSKGGPGGGKGGGGKGGGGFGGGKGGGGKGELTAFDLATGKPKWKWPGDGPSYGSPVVATLGGVKQVVVLTDANLIGVDAADGKLLWQTPLRGQRRSTATPVIDGDTVICMGAAFAITRDGEKFAVKQIWRGQAPHEYNTPVLKNGLLFGLAGIGRTSNIYCQDAKTGKVLWTDDTRRGECGAILDAGSVLVALTSDMNLVVFKPSNADFEEVATYKVADSPTWAYPILDGNRVYVKDRDSLALWVIE
jgi:outer membrane protein assembly factor BamB